MKFDFSSLDSKMGSGDWHAELVEIAKLFSTLKKSLFSSDAVQLDKELRRRVKQGVLLKSAPLIAFMSPSIVSRELRDIEFIQCAWNQYDFGLAIFEGWILYRGQLSELSSFKSVAVLEDGIQQYVQTSSRTKLIGVGATMELLNIGGKAPATHIRNELRDSRQFELALTGPGVQVRQKFKNSGVQTVRAALPFIEEHLMAENEKATASTGSDLATELTKLIELKDKGLLDEIEFAAAKARILGL